MGAWVKTATIFLTEVAQATVGVLIVFAVLCAILLLFASSFRRSVSETTESVRFILGRWLALALEFLLAADILKTAVAPTWDEIGQLASIIVIRTALNFFLQREIDLANKVGGSSSETERRHFERSPICR